MLILFFPFCFVFVLFFLFFFLFEIWMIFIVWKNPMDDNDSVPYLSSIQIYGEPMKSSTKLRYWYYCVFFFFLTLFCLILSNVVVNVLNWCILCMIISFYRPPLSSLWYQCNVGSFQLKYALISMQSFVLFRQVAFQIKNIKVVTKVL